MGSERVPDVEFKTFNGLTVFHIYVQEQQSPSRAFLNLQLQLLFYAKHGLVDYMF